MKATILAERVRRAVNEPPALTAEQIAGIGAILAEAVGGGVNVASAVRHSGSKGIEGHAAQGHLH